MPIGLVAEMRTTCLPGFNRLLNGERQGVAGFASTVQVNVEPATVEANRMVTQWAFVRFLGRFVTVVSGGGQAACTSFDCGQRSWVRSPNWSPSTSGSSTAEMLILWAAIGLLPGKSELVPGSKMSCRTSSPVAPTPQHVMEEALLLRPIDSPAVTGIRV